MFIIDKFYLNEARRIRLEYLDNLGEINKRVPFINKYKEKIQSYTKDLERIVSSNAQDAVKENEFMNSLENLNHDVETLEKEMKPYYSKIEQLTVDSEKLYNNILEKYIGIQPDDIKNQIYEHIKDLY